MFDLLVGLAPAQLLGVSPDRTVAVVSTAKTPTGLMVRDVHELYPDLGSLQGDLDEVTRGAQNRYFDATAITEGLFGESTTANVFQLGVAYQVGGIPVPADAIEQAIELNGAAVDANTLAFRWGRVWAADPDRVRAASVTAHDHLPKPSATLEAAVAAAGLSDGELGRLVRLRAADLLDYQDERYAQRYLDTVKAAAATGNSEFAEAVARNSYKLLAYKDEYEVARLHLETAAKLTVDNAVGTDARVSWNLQPPLLKRLGLDRKITVGPWFAPAFKALRASKRLRGTPLDPFGYAKVRRVERSLAKEYNALVVAAARQFSPANAATMIELANLPDGVRGYEEVKMRNVEHYRSELARLTSVLSL